MSDEKGKIVEKADYRSYIEWLNSRRYAEIRKIQYADDIKNPWRKAP